MREATSIIEDDLSAVAEGLTSVQLVDSYNRGFTSLTTETHNYFHPSTSTCAKKLKISSIAKCFFCASGIERVLRHLQMHITIILYSS